MRRLLLTSAAVALAAVVAGGAEYDVAAYVWPAYQPEPRWAELGIFDAGKGEWQNVWEAVPKWEGHRQPLVPLWGYENEANPKVMEKKIDAAVSHGVNWRMKILPITLCGGRCGIIYADSANERNVGNERRTAVKTGT